MMLPARVRRWLRLDFAVLWRARRTQPPPARGKSELKEPQPRWILDSGCPRNTGPYPTLNTIDVPFQATFTHRDGTPYLIATR